MRSAGGMMTGRRKRATVPHFAPQTSHKDCPGNESESIQVSAVKSLIYDTD